MVVKHITQPNELFFSNNRYKIPSDNEKRVLSAIFRHGTLSQPDIIKKTGISQQSVSRLVKAFIKQGILYQHHRKATGRPGQPSINVAVEPDFAFSLGVTIDVNKISVVLMNLCGKMISTAEHRVTTISKEHYCYQIVVIIDQLLQNARLDKQRLLGIGLGLPGFNSRGMQSLQKESEVINQYIPDIASELQNQLNTTVWVESDVTTAALGESLVGTGVKFQQFAYIHIGRQLNSAIVINGTPLLGAYGNSGEIDLLLSQSNTYTPTIASLHETISNANRNNLSAIPAGLDEFIAQFDEQWNGVNEWLDNIAPCFSRVASALAAILDPQAIIIGGDLPEPVATKLAQALQIFEGQPRLASRVKPQILISKARYNGCALGAATIPLRQYFFDES